VERLYSMDGLNRVIAADQGKVVTERQREQVD
jgi:hypothetical protein